jgi:hypothetical protein
MKVRTTVGILIVALVAVSIGAVAEGDSELIEIEIDVAPNVLSLDAAAEGKCVTVHTNIAYDDVNCGTLTLKVDEEELNIVGSCYSDDRGNLVVKVDRTSVTDVVSPPEATFTLTGETEDGTAFTGTDDIRVVDCSG